MGLIEEDTMNQQSILASLVVTALFSAFIGLKAYFLWHGSRQ
jgi:hypothetical protein